MNNELTELALDLRALATAEIDREYVLAVRDFLSGETEEVPEPSLYGLSDEEAQAIVLEVLLVESDEERAAA
jgi:hypothetical protein